MKFNREKFWDLYREKFGGPRAVLSQSVVNAIENLLDEFEKSPKWSNITHIAYAFATTKHETAHTFEPIKEYGPDSYFKKYDGRKDLGNNQPGDGLLFKGRGFVQLTGRTNYAKFGKLLGIDLVSNPRLAMDPDTAFQIMTIGMHKGLFTGHKLSDHINSTKKDLKEARRIINRLDKWSVIANYSEKFEEILRESKVSAAVTKPTDGNPKEAIEQAGSGDSTSSESSSDTQNTATQGQPPETNQTEPPKAEVVEVPQVKPEEQKQDFVSKFSAKLLAIPAAVLTYLSSVVAWATSAPMKLVLALVAVAAVITVIYLVMYLYLKNRREAREHELTKEREQRAFELQKITLESAMRKDLNTVVITPQPIKNSDSEVKE